jgi:DNA-binding MarR family transcriptional regulator
VNPGETGRSQIVFLPTAKATSLFEQKRSEVFNLEEWHKTKEKILEFLNSLKNCSLSDTIQKV